ncbi:hypothetical protein SAMN04488524_1158 [Pedobacter africanus]|uniref:Uncharacterized protein n=1 Tax=Pedobacter africanus TaxID=151894 RepID=A0A1W2A252_9SPHI|nr:hypothetical protein SAMN04488524_1158 [Pedobacter africanus]
MIVAFRSFLTQKVSSVNIHAGRDTVLGRVNIVCMQDIYETWPEMKVFARSVVTHYEERKESRRNVWLRQKPN